MINKKNIFALIILVSIFILILCVYLLQDDNNLPGIKKENVIINEILVKNELYIGGNFNDYIELYNNDNREISLDGWSLSDKEDRSVVLPLDGKNIAAKGYLVIFLDDSAGFALSANGETIYLHKNKTLINSLTYEALEENKSTPKGMYEFPTPGYANNEEGYLAYLATLTPPALMINEIITTNSKHMGTNGKYYDLLEVKNNTNSPLNLKDYYISDNKNNLTKASLPDVTLEAGAVHVFYCSGLTSNGHLPLKLSNSGEHLYISDKNEKCIDAINIPQGLTTDISYGRYNGVFQFMTATFGKENIQGRLEMLTPPAASVPAGIVDKSFSLSLSGDGDIYYTMDGTRPTQNSTPYKSQIEIKENTTIRTICVSGDYVSAEGCYSYLIGISHSIPVVTLSAPHSEIYNSNGIYTTRSKTKEVETNFTYIENNSQIFSVNCGITLHGNDSNELPKKGLQLHFRGKYGTGTLNYKLFENRDITSFNSILLKAGGEDARSTVLRDELCTAVVDGTTMLSIQAYKPVILYLNGEYQGIYYIRERFTEDYVASHFGVDADSVSIVASYQDRSGGYYALENYIKSHDMSNKEAYDHVISQINPIGLIDWFLCRGYFGDTDTANVRIFRSPDFDGGRWGWMFYDLDWAFYNESFLFSTIVSNQKMSLLMYKLMQNKDFQDMTLKRCAELFETTLNEARITAQLDKLVSEIGGEIEADRNYWLKHDPYSSSYTTWQNHIQKIRNYIEGDKRKTALIKDLKQYCSLSDDTIFEYFGIRL